MEETIEEGKEEGEEESMYSPPPHRWSRFSPHVRAVLTLLIWMRLAYFHIRAHIEAIITAHLGYSMLFFIVFTLLMIYPLMELMWYLAVRAALSLLIVLGVACIQKYFGPVLESMLLSN
jgi:hypothetical protein